MVLESVNFLFYPYCNFNCKYCFVQFENFIPGLSKQQCHEVINLLAETGIKKINFTVGESTLIPYIGDLLVYSKQLDLITSIISNGTGINRRFLKSYKNTIDWIGLSIDSGLESVNKRLGRGNGNLITNIIHKSSIIKEMGIRLKINTVVSKLNYNEDLSWLIKKIKPERWKVFQILRIRNQAQKCIDELLISEIEFKTFIKSHIHLKLIAESNDLMLNSYLMIDPIGRFYQNTKNSYNFSRPILEVGVQNALNDISFDFIKFMRRGGIYAW